MGLLMWELIEGETPFHDVANLDGMLPTPNPASRQPVSQPASQSASCQSASEAVSQVIQPKSQSAAQQASQSVRQSANQSGETPFHDVANLDGMLPTPNPAS